MFKLSLFALSKSIRRRIFGITSKIMSLVDKKLDWLNVHELIEYDTASLVYKIENDLASTHMKNMFMKLRELHSYSTRSAASGDFHLPKRNLNIGKTSFSYHGAYIWNQLPVQIREAQSNKCFQNCLKETIRNR